MDHEAIDERSVAESYVLGRLAPAEEASFEEHLLICRQCRERVRWAEELHGSLRAMAAEDQSRAAGLGLLAWLARRGRAARLGLAAALLVAVALPAGLLVDEVRLRRRLAEVRAVSAGGQVGQAAERERLADQLRRREAELRQAEGELRQRDAQARRGAGAVQQREARLRRLDAELGKERRRREELSARVAELSRPQVNAAIFSLGLVRGEGEANRVVLGLRPAWIVLSIELPAPGSGASSDGTYRAALVDGRGRTVWSGEGLRPSVNDTLVLGLYSSLLAPGQYRLVLEGPGESRERSEIAFEVAAEK
jgi:hypothetical protein